MTVPFESPTKFRNAWLILSILFIVKIYNSSLDKSEEALLLLDGPKFIYDKVFTPKSRLLLYELSSRSTRRKYIRARICRYANSDSCFQLLRIAKSGDVALNPGPLKENNEGVSKPKCQHCTRTVAKNHRAVQCKVCELWFHMKCASILSKDYKPSLSWMCSKCLLDVLPFNLSISSDEPENHDISISSSDPSPERLEPSILLERKKNYSDLLLVHLNINSIQNKFEELKLLNKELKSQLIFLTETKIDSTYPDEQFALQGYNIYRKDRKKGGGGIMSYVSLSITPQSRVRIPGNFKLIETLATKIKTPSNRDILVVGIYCPPKAVGKDYYNKLEEELNANWYVGYHELQFCYYHW